MSEVHLRRTRVRRSPQRWLPVLALLVVVVSVTTTVGVQPAGAAALTPTLTKTTFRHDHDGDGDGNLDPITADNPLRKDQGFYLGVDFTLAPPLAVGDTFEVQLPEELRGAANPSFDLVGPGGSAIGTCAVTATAFSCELTDPVVATWDTVDTFNVFFKAVAVQVTTETNLPFEVTGGGTFELPGPPGGVVIGQGTALPTEPRKGGWTATDRPGQIAWVVWLPATDAPTITLTDRLGAGEDQDLVPGSVQVWRTTEWDPHDVWGEPSVRYGADEISLDLADDLQSFDLTFPTRPGAVAYWVQYRSTVPPDVTFGDTFSNAVTGEGIDEDRTVTYNSTAGGTGGGSGTTTSTSTSTSTPVTSEPTTTTTVDGSVSSTTNPPAGDATTVVPPASSTPPAGTTTSGSTGSLPRTGGEPAPAVVAGVGLLALGAAVLAARRRLGAA